MPRHACFPRRKAVYDFIESPTHAQVDNKHTRGRVVYFGKLCRVVSPNDESIRVDLPLD